MKIGKILRTKTKFQQLKNLLKRLDKFFFFSFFFFGIKLVGRFISHTFELLTHTLCQLINFTFDKLFFFLSCNELNRSFFSLNCQFIRSSEIAFLKQNQKTFYTPTNKSHKIQQKKKKKIQLKFKSIKKNPKFSQTFILKL